jgi:peroxiredoxin/uncharacterized membrane protein YphA (DoxX/SURF4 family)
MGVALMTARLVLAVVFGVAGLAKLTDRDGFRDTLRNFGVPKGLAGALAMILPGCEVAVAVALMPVVSAWWGALGATVLLALFVGAISFNLAKGRKPRCRCFGQLHSTPIGWPTLVRNLGLAAVAGFIVAQERSNAGPSIVTWVRQQSPSTTILFAILLLETVLLVEVLKQQGRILRRLDIVEGQFARGGTLRGLAVGAPAPAFSLPNLEFRPITLDALHAKGLPLVLFFIDPDCGPCEALIPRMAEWQRNHADRLTMASISRGTEKANRTKIKNHRIGEVLLQHDREVHDAFKIDGTPTAVLVRADGTVGSPPATAAEDIESLIAGVIGELGASPLLSAAASKGNGHAAAGTPGLAA